MDTTQICDAVEHGIFVTNADESSHPATMTLAEAQHRLRALPALLGSTLDVHR